MDRETEAGKNGQWLLMKKCRQCLIRKIVEEETQGEIGIWPISNGGPFTTTESMSNVEYWNDM